MKKASEEDIIAYIEELESQNEFKSELISTSAHQLRTSLTANKWALQMLIKGDYGTLTEDQTKLLKKVATNSQEMIRVVSELIDTNHTEETHPTYSFGPINVHNLIEGVINDFQGESTERDIVISFDETGAKHAIIGDEAKLKMVLQALVENALKYSPVGGTIMVHTHTGEDEVIISVQDEGIGIPQEEQRHIFQKFYRAKNAREKHSVGSGIGLFSSAHVIEAHGGAIWFDSEKDKGSTFYVSLPFPPDEVIV